MNVLYEVNLKVEPEIRNDFEAWLTEHVKEMLKLPWFKDARYYVNLVAETQATEFVCHYYLNTKTDLDEYLNKDAARMRADGIQRFGDRFSATRRILIKA